MAANTYAVMDALAEDSSILPGTGAFWGPLDPFMYNPHETWHDALRPDRDGPPSEFIDVSLSYSGGQYNSTPLGHLERTLKQEKQQLGINLDTGEWTTASGLDYRNNLFRALINGGGGTIGGSPEPAIYDHDDTDIANAFTLSDLYLLGNTVMQCEANLKSFISFTNFLTGNDYNISTYHSELFAAFPKWDQLTKLSLQYDAANTTYNAHATIYASVNSTSVAFVSNSSPFAGIGTNSGLSFADGPDANTMAMWIYTANGAAEVGTQTGSSNYGRPAGMSYGINGLDDHPAELLTPKAVGAQMIAQVNNFIWVLRGYMDAKAGDHDPVGATPANTFIFEAKDWVEKYNESAQFVDIAARGVLPGATSPSISNALANT